MGHDAGSSGKNGSVRLASVSRAGDSLGAMPLNLGMEGRADTGEMVAQRRVRSTRTVKKTGTGNVEW